MADAALIESLKKDDSDVVRHEAAFILGERKREQKLADEKAAFEALCDSCLFDKSILVRHEGALALAAFGEQAEPYLQAALIDTVKEVRDSATYALQDMAS